MERWLKGAHQSCCKVLITWGSSLSGGIHSYTGPGSNWYRQYKLNWMLVWVLWWWVWLVPHTEQGSPGRDHYTVNDATWYNQLQKETFGWFNENEQKSEQSSIGCSWQHSWLSNGCWSWSSYGSNEGKNQSHLNLNVVSEVQSAQQLNGY